MSTSYTTQLLKIGKIAGMFYGSGKRADTIVIYGIGAPIPPDNGTLPDAPVIMRYNVDLFVPDYIGYGRSEGVFTPMNCIKTFLELYQAFSDGCVAKNSYDKVATTLQYKRIIFVGRSFGGTYVPVLPRFNPAITELAVFYPVVDSKSCGSIPGEETNEQFLGSMKRDGYYHLYRGALHPRWKKHLENQDNLSPMDNIKYLKDARLFIAHGKKDACVNYTKSQTYHKQLQTVFPDKKGDFKLKIYQTGDHGSSTSNKACVDMMRWFGLAPLHSNQTG